MRQVQVYIEGKKIELFEDEQINVTSSVQNISDISKVFTDFSQSFTVPASPHNNEILQYFYQSDLQQTIDQNIRRDAWIEINLTPFRRGKIQLEKANVKTNKVDSYTVTFYGDVLALKDRFGEDKLFNLDLSSLEFEFNGTEVYDRITDLTTDYDVRYPLIANTRFWQYHTGGSCKLAASLRELGGSPLMKGDFVSDVECECFWNDDGFLSTRPKKGQQTTEL